MPDLSAPLKLGANCWNQYTDWPSWIDAQQRAERLGYDSLWTWDHLYPIVGSDRGPILECYTAMAALATTTERATIGLMVGANTFRNPALVAKMITTLDHISGGRAILGIGAAWFETEHVAFGIPFGVEPGRTSALAGRGVADHARDARRDEADRRRRQLRGPRRAEPAGAGPAAPSDPHRREWAQGHAATRRPLRRCLQRRRDHRVRRPEGAAPRGALRSRRAR